LLDSFFWGGAKHKFRGQLPQGPPRGYVSVWDITVLRSYDESCSLRHRKSCDR